MKLLDALACQLAIAKGNCKKLTVMGEVFAGGFSDRSSILLISIILKSLDSLFN